MFRPLLLLLLLLLPLLPPFICLATGTTYPHSLTMKGPPMLISHSFKNNPSFGAAQAVHGCTFSPSVTFLTKKLHPANNWVVDIGWLSETMAKICKKYHLQNPDELFPSVMTTTEWMARQLHNDIKTYLGEIEFEGSIRVAVKESDIAVASYQCEV